MKNEEKKKNNTTLDSKNFYLVESFIIINTICIIILFSLFVSFVEGYLSLKIVFGIITLLLLITGIVIACHIERTTGYYECKQCGHKHIPTIKNYLLSMHIGFTRKLKCSNCNKKTWQKKKFN